jgi:nucleoside-diphosphate-sugar epimerase
MKRAIVVGSHGFIGGYVCHRLISEGWEVVGVDNVNMYKPKNYQLFTRHFELRQQRLLKGLKEFYRMDASHGIEFSRVVQQHQPDLVINLGGTSVADVCKKNIDEAVSSIYLLNANILQSLKEHKALDRYVYVSSSMVYGDFTCERPDEDVPKQPKDPYGAVKLGGELLVQSFNRQFGLPYVIIRPSAVYGPLDSNMRVTGIFMLNAALGKPLKINDVKERLDFTFVEDTAEGIFLAATKKEAKNEVFNITRGEGRTIAELAEVIKTHFPQADIFMNSEAEHMEGLIRPQRGSLNIEKARRLLGYNPKYSLREGIQRYAEEWKRIFTDNSAFM